MGSVYNEVCSFQFSKYRPTRLSDDWGIFRFCGFGLTLKTRRCTKQPKPYQMKTSILSLPHTITGFLIMAQIREPGPSAESSPSALEGLHWLNGWYIALALEVMIVLFILAKLIRAQRSYRADQSKYEDLLKTVRKDLNMKTVEKNAHQARKLYRELRRKYHPDKFKDQYQKALAHELIQEISIHRDRYDKLTQLKQKAEQNLGIKI